MIWKACFDKMNGCILFESETTLFKYTSLFENEKAIVVIQWEFWGKMC